MQEPGTLEQQGSAVEDPQGKQQSDAEEKTCKVCSCGPINSLACAVMQHGCERSSAVVRATCFHATLSLLEQLPACRSEAAGPLVYSVSASAVGLWGTCASWLAGWLGAIEQLARCRFYQRSCGKKHKCLIGAVASSCGSDQACGAGKCQGMRLDPDGTVGTTLISTTGVQAPASNTLYQVDLAHQTRLTHSIRCS